MEDLFKQEDFARQYVSSLADLAVTPSIGQTADIATSSETTTTENALLNSVPLASSQPFSPGEPVTALPASVTSTMETNTETSTPTEPTNTSWATSTSTTSQPTTSTTSTTSSLISIASSTSTLSTTAVFSATTSASEQTTEQTKSNPVTTEPGSYSGGTSTKTKIAIAVPISIVGIALIIALIIFLTRRRRRAKERHNIPTPYDMATSQTTAVSTQELVVSPIHAALSPGPQTTTAAVPLSRTPVLNVPPFIDGQSRDPSPSPSSTRRMPVSQGPGPNDSSTEIGLAVAVSLDHRRSATEQELRSPSWGTVRLARMPFDNSYDPEDDAVSEASDSDGRRRDREFDEISDVSSFGAFSPTWDGGRRQYR
ncbi:hypothetical protein N7499_005619 [Penicillium canescens]|nr:hypothetical protein N7499_005619 [Penicillium canescens]KAJ6177464.1 hypothetical protein N7485_004378 [Penicillium canescens]